MGIVLRRNLFPNPVASINATSWTNGAGTGGIATGAQQTGQTGWWFATTSYRVTWTTATTTVSGALFAGRPSVSDIPVVTGKTYSAMIQARCSKVQRVSPQIVWTDAAGTTVSVTNGAQVVVAANAVTTLTVSAAVAPVNAVRAEIVVTSSVGTSGVVWNVGDWLEATHGHFEGTAQTLLPGTGAGGTSLTGAFQGDLAAATYGVQNYYAWEGAANASASIQFVRLRATSEPGNLPPRVLLELDLADLTPDPTTATVLRRDPDGRSRAVRLAEPAALIAGVWSGYDYESPFGAPVTYTVTAGVDAAVAAPVTLTVTDTAWLRHPGVPSLSVPVPLVRFRKESFAARSRATSRAVFTPLGRSDPLVVTSGARRSVETSMVLRTDTEAEREALWTIVGDETVLLLDVPPSRAWGVTHEYVSVGDVAEARLADWGAHLGRVFTLPYLVVDRPAGGLQAQFTYANVLADHTTYADVLSRYNTYADLLANRRRLGVLPGYGDPIYGEGVYGL